MTRVAALSAAAKSSTAKFHELRLKYWNKDLDVICCVEGNEDLEYYLPEVRRMVRSRTQIDGFVCAGKYNTLECFKKAKRRRFRLSRLFFMVDSDLDQFLGIGRISNPSLYYTDFYSVESHCISRAFFEAVWVDVFHLSLADPRFPQWASRYMDGFQWIAELLQPLFALAIECKRAGGTVEFDRLELDSYFEIDSAGLVKRRRCKSRRKKKVAPVVQPNSPLPRADVLKMFGGLSRTNFMHWLRGKYALVFAIAYLKRMKAILGAKGSVPRAVIRYQFSLENGVDCIASRSPYPISLVHFLQGKAAIIDAEGTLPGVV